MGHRSGVRPVRGRCAPRRSRRCAAETVSSSAWIRGRRRRRGRREGPRTRRSAQDRGDAASDARMSEDALAWKQVAGDAGTSRRLPRPSDQKPTSSPNWTRRGSEMVQPALPKLASFGVPDVVAAEVLGVEHVESVDGQPEARPPEGEILAQPEVEHLVGRCVEARRESADCRCRRNGRPRPDCCRCRWWRPR